MVLTKGEPAQPLALVRERAVRAEPPGFGPENVKDFLLLLC